MNKHISDRELLDAAWNEANEEHAKVDALRKEVAGLRTLLRRCCDELDNGELWAIVSDELAEACHGM